MKSSAPKLALLCTPCVLAAALASCERARVGSDPAGQTVHIRIQNGRAECNVTDGKVFCRGDGSRGLLGTGTSIEHSADFRHVEPLRDVTALAVSEGAVFACAVTKGDVWCWGDNVSGTLGRSDATAYDGSPRSISKPQPVALPPSRRVAIGVTHACSLSTTGTVHCWGMNAVGEVLDPRVEPRIGVAPPVEVPVPSGVTDLFLTTLQSCVLTDRREVHCWGGSVGGPDGSKPAFAPTLVARDALELPRDLGGDGRSCVKTKSGDVCWDYAVDEVIGLYQEPHIVRQK